MIKKTDVHYIQRDMETAEEIIGVLTAISVISKRMAKKVALLEQISAETDDNANIGKKANAKQQNKNKRR